MIVEYKGYKIQQTYCGFVVLWSGGILGGLIHDTLDDTKRYIDTCPQRQWEHKS